MDVLTNKQYLKYSSLSRYSNIPIYYNIFDDKWENGLTHNLKTDTSFTLHTITQVDTLDNLALTYYGRPDYYWVIANFNNIDDCLIDLFPKYKTIKIPVLNTIAYKEV